MPKVTLYVREDDLEAFEAIPNKPEWLHNAIMAESAGHIETKPVEQVINVLPTVMPTTLEEANDPESPGYSADIRPDSHYEPIDDMP